MRLPSHHLYVGLNCARRLDRLEYRDQVTWTNAKRIETIDQLLQRNTIFNDGELFSVLLNSDAGARHNSRVAATAEWQRLTYFGRFTDRYRQVALCDRHHRNAHVASHDDNARAFVDHDFGAKIRLDLKLLDLSQQRNYVAAILRRNGNTDGCRIERFCRWRSDIIIDRSRDAFRGREIRIPQCHPQLAKTVQCELDLTLDQRAIGDTADCWHATRDLGGVAFRLEAADRQRTLCNRTHIAIGAEQRCDEQCAALQTL